MWNLSGWVHALAFFSPHSEKQLILLQYSAKQIIQSQIRIEFQFARKTLQSPLCQYRAGFCSFCKIDILSASLVWAVKHNNTAHPHLPIASFYWSVCRCSSANGFIHVLLSGNHVPVCAVRFFLAFSDPVYYESS